MNKAKNEAKRGGAGSLRPAGKDGTAGIVPGSPWSRAEDDLLSSLIASGTGWRACAERIGRSCESCRSRWRKLLMANRRRCFIKPRRWTHEEDDRLASLWQQGVCVSDIAEQLDRTEKAVAGRASMLGISSSAAAGRGRKRKPKKAQAVHLPRAEKKCVARQKEAPARPKAKQAHMDGLLRQEQEPAPQDACLETAPETPAWERELKPLPSWAPRPDPRWWRSEEDQKVRRWWGKAPAERLVEALGRSLEDIAARALLVCIAEPEKKMRRGLPLKFQTAALTRSERRDGNVTLGCEDAAIVQACTRHAYDKDRE